MNPCYPHLRPLANLPTLPLGRLQLQLRAGEVDVPQPAPDIVPLPPTPHPGLPGQTPDTPPLIPPEMPPFPVQPEIIEPTLPGEHSPIRDPWEPGQRQPQLGGSEGALDLLGVNHRQSSQWESRESRESRCTTRRRGAGWLLPFTVGVDLSAFAPRRRLPRLCSLRGRGAALVQ